MKKLYFDWWYIHNFTFGLDKNISSFVPFFLFTGSFLKMKELSDITVLIKTFFLKV